MTKTIPMPPRAEKQPRVETWHGHEKRDDYHWLKAENWQQVMQDPAVLPSKIRAFLEGENAYHEAIMADTAALQEKLFAEMKGRIKEDDSSVPAPDGPWSYYSSFVTGGQHPRYLRKARDLTGPEQMILDGNALAKGREYFRFGGIAMSPDQRLAAWSFDGNGSEFYELKVRDVAAGSDLPDLLQNTAGGATWAADGKTFFYTLQDENHRPLKTFRHRLGTAQDADVLVYEEQDTGMFTGVGKTNSEAYIVIDVHDHDTSEIRIIDAKAPEAEPRLIAPRQVGVEYDLEHWNDRFVIKTNIGGAEDYKIVTAPVANPGPENWTDLIPHRPGIFLVGFIVLKNWLVRMERENALPRIVVRDMASGAEHAIAFDEEAYSLGFGEMREYDTDVLRFTYSSMTTPSQVFDYNMRDRTRVLRKMQEIPSGHDPKAYVTRRVLAPAHDGETIPVTLLYRKEAKLDGSAPLWLYGYGSYGISLPAGLQQQHPVAGGSRLHLCHGPYPRRAGERPALVQDRQAGTEDQYLPRLHRGRRIPGGAGLHAARQHRGAGRQCRRHADGRGGQHGARSLPRHRGGSALRRRADHHARRHAAADAARMARMGQSDRRQAGLRDHRLVLAL